MTDFSAQKYAELQFAAPPEIKEVQPRLFFQHLEYILARFAFYRKLYARENIDITRIKSLADIKLLPLTHKTDLLNTHDLLCTDRNEIVDTSLTSATSGIHEIPAKGVNQRIP